MKTLPTLHPITTPVATLHPDTLRECALVKQRMSRGYLTGAEAFELREVQARNDARARAADLANDQRTEAHAFPRSANPHCD